MAVVAVDFDEVLAPFVPVLARWHNKHYGTDLKEDAFWSYNFWEVWGGTREETDVKVREFFASEEFHSIRPLEGAKEGIEQLRAEGDVDLVVVTSRQEFLKDRTRSFIEEHFTEVFTDICFGNHYLAKGEEAHYVTRSKPQMCKDIGASILIDDSAKYIEQCVSMGIHGVLFGKYAWNEHAWEPNFAEKLHSDKTGRMAAASSWPEASHFVRTALKGTAFSLPQ